MLLASTGVGNMWLVELIKRLLAAWSAARAAKAAAELPAGQTALDQIDADGATIDAQLKIGATR